MDGINKIVVSNNEDITGGNEGNTDKIDEKNTDVNIGSGSYIGKDNFYNSSKKNNSSPLLEEMKLRKQYVDKYNSVV